MPIGYVFVGFELRTELNDQDSGVSRRTISNSLVSARDADARRGGDVMSHLLSTCLVGSCLFSGFELSESEIAKNPKVYHI